MIRRVVFFAGALSLFCCLVYGEEKFPFLGEIITNRVNVRAGQNINFERLCQLNQGEEIIVVGKSYDWYKINLPFSVSCYISEQYVQLEPDGSGMITASGVNIRAGSGDRFSVIGQLTKGAKVKVKAHAAGWYTIEPIETSYGWVSDKFVSFKSAHVPPYSSLASTRQESPTEIKNTNFEKKEQPQTISAIGRLEDLGRTVRSKDIRYKLVVDDKTTYYLEGQRSILDGFVNYKVQIEGRVKAKPEGFYAFPVVIVSKIKLVL